MYKKYKILFPILCLVMGFGAQAQVTVQSPYSKFGVGNIKGTLTPQWRAMGGITTAIGKNSFFNNINAANPASFALTDATAIDMGASTSFNEIRNSSMSEKTFNGSLSHVAFSFKTGNRAGLSFGALPYSELGYDFSTAGKLGNSTDTQRDVNYLYRGEGGLTKAYLGYGIGIGDNFRVGANLEYLFGSLTDVRSTQFVNDPGAISSRIQDKNSIGGFTYSYGAQYDFRIDNRTSVTVGYSGSSSNKINSKKSVYVTQYNLAPNGEENSAIDTLFSTENEKTNLKMPLMHSIGVVVQKYERWLIGADYRMGKWSDLTIDRVNQRLQDTYGFSLGGQYIPDFGSVNSYFKRVEYRLGFSYDKTYIQMNNRDVKQMAVTFGFGLPMSTYSRGTFYKANLAFELGQRGSISNGLLQERYFNIHVGFTLNDGSWGQRYRLD